MPLAPCVWHMGQTWRNGMRQIVDGKVSSMEIPLHWLVTGPWLQTNVSWRGLWTEIKTIWPRDSGSPTAQIDWLTQFQGVEFKLNLSIQKNNFLWNWWSCFKSISHMVCWLFLVHTCHKTSQSLEVVGVRYISIVGSGWITVIHLSDFGFISCVTVSPLHNSDSLMMPIMLWSSPEGDRLVWTLKRLVAPVNVQSCACIPCYCNLLGMTPL